jgi:arsenate reductase (thioredoxin)
MVPPDDIKTGEIKPGYRGNRHRMGGDRNLKPRTPALTGAPVIAPLAAPAKQRVLFVCIGNSCRSQMAEAFARAYGSDVMVAQSAGLSPAAIIAPLTKQVLAERNLNIDGHFPKGVEVFTHEAFDLVINMSGHPLSLPNTRMLAWVVRDPIGQPEALYREVVQQIEGLVMGLILQMRSQQI